jgi:tRNA modification GTPase
LVDPIFALSSGAPPAAIAIVRISGPRALAALTTLTRGAAVEARVARLRTLHHPTGGVLDRALVLCFPGPDTATGEDLVELHLHGGRAVVRAVEAALAELPGLRGADAGEFTRRALANGRIDLAEAEGLADLLAAETEMQRRVAMASVDGHLSRRVRSWRTALVGLAARVEAALDFSDEIDVAADHLLFAAVRAEATAIAEDMARILAAPRTERLRDGIHVVLAGPPNSGKSTLLNALSEREVAIVSPIAGTTRDRIESAVVHDGIPFLLTDTAGLRDDVGDEIERIGIERASAAVAASDIVVWLGDDRPVDEAWLWIRARADLPGRAGMEVDQRLAVSGATGQGIAALWEELGARARLLIPGPNDSAINARQAGLCEAALSALADVGSTDELVIADALRRANAQLGRITGDVSVESTLDALFSRFCIGK